MADKITKIVEIEFDVNGKKIKEVSKNIDEVSKNTEKSKKGVNGLSDGFKKVGTAMKAAGIGLVVALLAKLAQSLGENQKVADLFTTAMNALSIAFQDFFEFIENNVGPVTDFFKEIFENPVDSIKAFGDAIQENLIERFNSFLDTIGYLSSAIKKLFSGDFDGALEDAALAGKEYLDVLTGVNNSFDKAVEFVSEAIEVVGEYAISTWDSAAALTEQAKQTNLLALEQQRLREQYDRDAENLRQIRDDETKSFEERIEANRLLGKLLDEQQKSEQETVKKRIANLQNLQQQLGFNQERYEEIYELETELIAIEAQQAGFRSEQLVNENALLREQAEFIQKQKDDLLKAAIARQTALDEYEIARMQEGIDKELAMSAAKYDALYAQAEGNAELQKLITEDQAQEAYDIQKKYDDKRKQDQKAAAESTVAVAEATFDALSALNDSFGKKDEKGRREAFKREKALGIAQATINTAKSAVSAYNSMAGIPFVGPVLAPIAAAAAIAAGAAQIKNIASQKYKGEGGGDGGGSAAAAPTSAPSQAPQFNTVGTSDVNVLDESISKQNKKPVQAYVVSGEVTTAQSMERNRIKESSFP